MIVVFSDICVTDACISWEQTVPTLERLREGVRGRREALRRKAMGTVFTSANGVNGINGVNGHGINGHGVHDMNDKHD
jgi:3-deoxy-7-phosphoheptulonate synthase